MQGEGSVILTIHGLDVDNGLVRADVFLKKFRALLNSIEIADKHLNGKKSHNIIITDLKNGSAMAAVREKVSVKKKVPAFGAPFVAEALNAVYNGDRRLDRFPPELIKSFEPLVKIDDRMSHGEVEFAGADIIRIDDYLARQTERALDHAKGIEEKSERHFEGIAHGVFDGVLKLIDSRGALVRGKLILTAGGKEIDCIFKRGDIPILLENFERRARVEAVAHYDGENVLPVRLDVKRITPISINPDLGRWRGTLANRRVPRPEGI
jgi:hypothetical protein